MTSAARHGAGSYIGEAKVINGNNIPGGDPSAQQNAMSVYGQDAMDDFPVLKAFQKYIDAEQAKAQKRTMTLCIFFAVIMAIVVGVFVMLLMNISSRNNALNDQLSSHNSAMNEQLIKMLMERGQPVSQPAAQQPQNDAAIKALTDTVANLQKQLGEQQMKMIEQQTKVAQEAAKRAAEAAAAAPAAAAGAASAEELRDKERKVRTDAEKLKKATERLAQEKAKLAKEKEILRQKEIEIQRRKLYPEYYERLEREKNRPAASSPSALVPSDDVDDIIGSALKEMDRQPQAPSVKGAPAPKVNPDGTLRYFDEEDDDSATVVEPARKQPAPKTRPAAAKPPAPVVQEDGTLRYFSDDAKETTVPVSVGGSTSSWDVPLE